MHGIRHFSNVVATLNLCALLLFFLAGLAWKLLDNEIGIWLFWGMIYLSATCTSMSLLTQACRLPDKLRIFKILPAGSYRFAMLVFLFIAFTALITCIIDVSYTPDIDAFLTIIFLGKLYNVARNARIC